MDFFNLVVFYFEFEVKNICILVFECLVFFMVNCVFVLVFVELLIYDEKVIG